MQAYARQAKDTSLMTQATEIRMRAERRAGELLIEMAVRKERETKGGDRRSKLHAATLIAPKLADLGISKTQSSRWQKLASLDADHFEEKVESASKRAYDRITYRFLKQAEIERAKTRHAKLIEHGCTVDDLTALAEFSKRFSVIYADPPWPWAGNLGVECRARITTTGSTRLPRSRVSRRRCSPPTTARCCCGVLGLISRSAATLRSSGHGASSRARSRSFGSSKTAATAGSALAVRAVGQLLTQKFASSRPRTRRFASRSMFIRS